MAEPATALSAWESFYVIVGSSGAALIGLQFVVIAIIADSRRRASAGSISAYGTPTVIHFGGALLVSAVMSAPWGSLGAAAIALGLCGLAGLAYGALTIVRARRQTAYRPVWEDWLWHTILPCAAYLALALGALCLGAAPRGALFAIAGAALTLLFVGIHNSWDAVTYHVVSRSQADASTSGDSGE